MPGHQPGLSAFGGHQAKSNTPPLPLPRAFFLPTSQASLALVATILMTILGAGSCQGKHGTELRDHADTCHSCAGLLARHGSSFPGLFLLLCAIGQKDLPQAALESWLVKTLKVLICSPASWT